MNYETKKRWNNVFIASLVLFYILVSSNTFVHAKNLGVYQNSFYNTPGGIQLSGLSYTANSIEVIHDICGPGTVGVKFSLGESPEEGKHWKIKVYNITITGYDASGNDIGTSIGNYGQVFYSDTENASIVAINQNNSAFFGGGHPELVASMRIQLNFTGSDVSYSTEDCSYGAGEEIQPLTCTQDKKTRYTCSVCGGHKDVFEYATGHNWQKVYDSELTCTQDKTFHYRCDKCDETWYDPSFIEAYAKKHNFTVTNDNSHLRSSATKCTERSTAWNKCSDCNEYADGSDGFGDRRGVSRESCYHEYGDPLTHIWNATSNRQYQKLTCTQDERNFYNCSRPNCPAPESNQDPSLTYVKTQHRGHTYHLIVDTDLTCTQSMTGHRECFNDEHDDSIDHEAKKESVSSRVFYEAPGHHFEELVNDSEATCTKEGYSHYVCTNTINGVRCTETNSIKGNFKTADHSSFVVNPTGHYITKDSITKKPTVYNNGTRGYTCEYCGEEVMEDRGRFSVFFFIFPLESLEFVYKFLINF